MTQNIRQIGNGKEFLTKDALVPLTSLWAQTPSPQASAKYRQVKTVDVIDLFANQGWLPVTAQEQRVNKVEREGFQKHLIRFRHESFTLPQKLGDHIPEIILKNSHDTTSSYQLLFGLFRLACLNGLIVSEAEFGTIRIFHLGFDESRIIDATHRFVEGAPLILGRVDQYRRIELTTSEQRAFAESALLVKLNPPEDVIDLRLENDIYQIGERRFDTSSLIRPLRREDQPPTLWNTYNIVQEKLVGGNKSELNRRGRKKQLRGITAIDENIRVNRGLWHLLSELAKSKGVTATA
jgi:hypothetical protein